MRILYASYEVAPLFQTGGLGEVAYSLSSALAKVGIEVTLVLPWYQAVSLTKKPKEIGRFSLEFNNHKQIVGVFSLSLQKNISLYLFDHPFLKMAIEKRDKAKKFIFFSKAIVEMLTCYNRQKFGVFDILHLNDWHTAPVSFFIFRLTNRNSYPPTILTIHNLLYQGTIKKEKLINLLQLKPDEINQTDSILGIGILYADYITTVSPNYAYEITHTKLGFNLQRLLLKKRKQILGILNGIDYQKWNPKTDPAIYQKYDSQKVFPAKIHNKTALQKELKLPVNSSLPLISFIGRLEPRQKGIDLLYSLLKNMLPEKNFQFVLLGTGNPYWARKISLLVSRYHQNFAFINKFDEVLSHKIYAASDIILIPSRFEPCGLVQMIAMRYGTLPLARKTGGLSDTVKDRLNGFVIEKYSPTALARTLRLAIKMFKDNPEKIAKMRKRAMKEDFSWDKSAREYKKLYQKITKDYKGD